jgi:hypothetical protein
MNNDLFDPEEINAILNNKYRDIMPKEIGDRVTILDYSSCTHLNGKELDDEQDEEMQFNDLTYFIVIANGQNNRFNAYYTIYRQDLVIVNPLTNVQFRVNSGHVQLKK